MFFFPLRDDNPTRTRPWLSWGLIAACCVMFLWQLGQADMAAFIHHFGVVPAALLQGADMQPIPAWMTVFSSMFLHGGFAHLLGNMLFLWIFGDNVEEAIGARYGLFYLLCGVVAALAQSAIAPHSLIPMIGASGAIAGVLGAYLVLYPMANIRCLIGFFIFFRIINVPAFLILGGWLLLQFLNLGQLSGEEGGVAYIAHIGGFLSGVLLIFVFKKPNIGAFAPAHSVAFAGGAVTKEWRRALHVPTSQGRKDNPWGN